MYIYIGLEITVYIAACARTESMLNVQELVAVRRKQLSSKSGRREKMHLLLLYPALCACIVSPEPQMREILQDILLQAGGELGLSEPSTSDDFVT